MTRFPGSPRVARGALIALNDDRRPVKTIVLQYNPEALTRSLTPRNAESGSRTEALFLGGAPEETISLDAEVDATDQLERSDPQAMAMGIHPELAALELLIYPPSSRILTERTLLTFGTIEIIPQAPPLLLFVWGKRRVVPVKIQSLRIAEQAYDPSLNPIRATVSLEMKVISYSDLPARHLGSQLFLAHQAAKEAMAVTGAVSDLGLQGGRLPL